MDILKSLKRLRDELRLWVINNLNALNAKIEERTIHIDSKLDTSSSNPVQNKAIAKKIDELSIEIANKSTFSGDYNDLKNAPNIIENDDGTLIVVDDNGNIIFNVNESGVHTTSLSLKGKDVEEIIDAKVSSEVSALVGTAPDKLNTLDELAAALGDDENFATTVLTQLSDKVDKVEGKGLSTNDFTDEFKSQLVNTPDWTKGDKPTLADLDDDTNHRTVTDTEKAIWNNKSDFTGDYNDLRNAPNMYEDESGALVVADPDGNIIFRSDADGIETTQLITKTLILDGVDIEDKVIFYEVEKVLELELSDNIEIVCSDDGSGNITLEIPGAKVVDDGHGNISISSDYITVADNGNGNININW